MNEIFLTKAMFSNGIGVALTLAMATVIALPAHAQDTSVAATTESANKETVRQAYAEWEAGGTRFFDILDDRVVWTILGTGPHAKTYRSKSAFVNAAVVPFAARLSTPLKPTVQSIHADGDDVIILWDGVAVRRDGKTYRNTYTWFFTMRGSRVVEAKALLNLEAYNDVLANVPAAPKPKP
jgi:uncharacterized protein